MDFISHSLMLFHKGGLVMYPLLACSIIVVAIAWERFLYYRNAHTDLETLLLKIRPELQQGCFAAALKSCENSIGAAAELLAIGIKRRQSSPQVLENVLQGAAAYSAGRLKERLNYLDTIITISPLLGLLGTVVGMIQSFSVFNVQTGQPAAITGGVGEALVATASGLCVAILALMVHTYFSHRLDVIISEMEKACTYILDSEEWGNS